MTARRITVLALVTVLLAAMSAQLTPGPLSLAITITVVAGLGIPHGAADHLVAAAAWPSAADRRAAIHRIDRRYVAAMAAFSVVWLLAPSLALATFLVLSVHHFGQSDLASITIPSPWRWALQWSRGTFLIGVPLLVHLDDAAPVLIRLGGDDLVASAGSADHRAVWVAVLIVSHLAVLIAASSVLARSALIQQMIGVLALTVLFVAAEPLIGFAVYFGLWHSLPHLIALGRVLGTADDPRPVASLARVLAPRWAIACGLLAAGTAAALLAGRADLVLPATVVLLSLLTLPHMVVVERMWRTWPPQSGGDDVSGLLDEIAQGASRGTEQRRHAL